MSDRSTCPTDSSLSSSPTIVAEINDSIAILRFNRPAERNPLSIATLAELQRNLSAIIARSDLKAIVFTGAEDVFASGANIRELTQLDSTAAKGFAKFGHSLFQSIADAKQLSIAAINGYCMGGALDLALACDIRGLPETQSSLILVRGWE